MEQEPISIKQTEKARQSITVFFFLSGFSFSSWASRIPAIQHQLKLNEASLGAVLFALPLGLMCTLPVTGNLLRRYSSRNIMLIGALSFNMMLSLLGFATQIWQLVIILFFFGCSRNLLNISMNTQSVGVQALYSKSIITTFHGIWSVAGFTGAAVGSIMVSANITPAYHLLFSGVLMIILALVFFEGNLKQKPAPQSGKQARFLLPDKTLLKFGLISFACMACEGTMYDWSGIYFQKAVHASKDLVTAGFAVYMIAMAAGRFTGDKLVHRVGLKKLLKYSGLLIGCGLMMAVILPHPIPAGIGFMMTGLGVSCVVPLIFSLAGKSKSLSSGAAIASVSTIGYLGFLLVPPAVGFIAQGAGLRWAFVFVAVLGSAISWLVMQLKDDE